ncbi:MAG: hypothetical protein H7321_01415 [Bacteroidia bacterium]|nr:hypothetical protein [Bacteroidia bacterium]
MKKKMIIAASALLIAVTGTTYALSTKTNSNCCDTKVCNETCCGTECSCGDNCTGEDCNCGCSCCK